MVKKAKKKMAFLKLDFCKAFDNVDWGLLMGVMEAMGFGPKWIGWIRNFVLEQRITVLVNGSIAAGFDMEQGASPRGSPVPTHVPISNEG